MRDTSGERFVDEMQPRDVVSRASTLRMQELGSTHVFLDATGLDHFDQRFPNIEASLREVGLDPARDWLPVAPAAHYTCGGIVTDLNGASSLPGLWAAGEVSCSGVHGANRLASNSLLEGMVFGPRAVEAIEAGVVGPEASGAMRTVLGIDPDRPDTVPAGVIGGRFVRLEPEAPPIAARGSRPDGLGRGPLVIEVSGAAPREVDVAEVRALMQRELTANAGVVRDAGSLSSAAACIEAVLSACRGRQPDIAGNELLNLATVSRAAVDAARRREESRGAHTREDHPAPRPEFEHRIVYV